MSQLKLNQVADAEIIDSRWHWLYKFGGAADVIRWAACRGTNSRSDATPRFRYRPHEAAE
jgi:hypothetical protein